VGVCEGAARGSRTWGCAVMGTSVNHSVQQRGLTGVPEQEGLWRGDEQAVKRERKQPRSSFTAGLEGVHGLLPRPCKAHGAYTPNHTQPHPHTQPRNDGSHRWAPATAALSAAL